MIYAVFVLSPLTLYINCRFFIGLVARLLASAEYWKHFIARFNGVHAFGYNSAESEWICAWQYVGYKFAYQARCLLSFILSVIGFVFVANVMLPYSVTNHIHYTLYVLLCYVISFYVSVVGLSISYHIIGHCFQYHALNHRWKKRSPPKNKKTLKNVKNVTKIKNVCKRWIKKR